MSPKVCFIAFGSSYYCDFGSRDDRVMVVASPYYFFRQRVKKWIFSCHFYQQDLPKHSADCRVVIAEEAYCPLAIGASIQAVAVKESLQRPVDC